MSFFLNYGIVMHLAINYLKILCLAIILEQCMKIITWTASTRRKINSTNYCKFMPNNKINRAGKETTNKSNSVIEKSTKVQSFNK